MVADMAADIVVHMEFDIVANQEVDKVCEFICNAFSKCIVVPSKSDTRRRCLVNMM